MPVLDMPPTRDTTSTRTTTVDSESERTRPPTSRPPEPGTPRVQTPTITRTTPDQVVDDTQRIPAQTAPSTDAERVGQRTVAGRTVVFSDANYNRTLHGIRIAGAVGLVVGAMGIAQQVNELYALRQMNQQDPSEGITEEEFQKELANIAGSVLGGVAGAYLGAKVGGFIGGVTGGPWGALAGGITGGVFGGLTGESTGELIGAAIFDQLTGSNTFEELWNRRQDDARRNLAADASTLGAEPETVAERVVQQQQAQQEQQQRRLAGIDQPFVNPELERVIRDLQTSRRNLQGNPTNRRLQNAVANQERGLRNLLNSRSFRVTDEDRQRAQSFLDGRAELQDTPVNPVTDNLVTPSSYSVVDTATQPSINAVSIIQLLSGVEFNSINIEASRIEFDGKIEAPGQSRVIQYATRITAPTAAPVASTEITPTAPTASAASRPAPGGGGVLSRLGRSIVGGRTQASPPSVPAPAQQTSVTPVTPSIGGDSGTGGGSTGSITEIIERGPGFNVVKYDDGRVERRTGTRNWRNNNPGNIEFGDFARRYGAIGTDGRFAIFPSYEVGKRAKEALLFEGRNYSGLTIAQAITRYAPPSENDTAMYIRVAAAAAGVSPGTRMQSLNSEQRRALLSAMERVEGFRVGSVQVIQQGTAVASAEQAPPGPGPTLAAEGAQMAAADQAQVRGQGQEVIVQVPPVSPQQRIAAVEQQAPSGARGEVSLNRRLEKQVA
jgi:hypothetical protein